MLTFGCDALNVLRFIFDPDKSGFAVFSEHGAVVWTVREVFTLAQSFQFSQNHNRDANIKFSYKHNQDIAKKSKIYKLIMRKL